MKNICFDLCAIPIFLLIIYTYYSRRITRYREYQMFFIMAIVSLVCALLDVGMEFVVFPTPLTAGEVALGTAMSFTYKLLRNACMVLYLVFIIGATRTAYQFRNVWVKVALWAPYAVLCLMLLQNFFTGNVFSVTAEQGYSRGPLLVSLYVISGFYDVVGIAYCVSCRKLLEREKWLALLSVYVLTTIAVAVQMFHADLLLELFSTAIGLLMVMMLVLKPEDAIDSTVGALNWKSFLRDLRNYHIEKQPIGLFAFQMQNARENRFHLGDSRYTAYVAEILDALHAHAEAQHMRFQVYYEQPEGIYLIVEGSDYDPDAFVAGFFAAAKDRLRESNRSSVWFNPLACHIRVPEEMADVGEIVNLCHRFVSLNDRSKPLVKASDFVGTKDFEVLNHIEGILDGAVYNGSLKMYYQPIYSIKDSAFRSAEALARIDDKRFGLVSPMLFIPVAERSGMMLLLGQAIIEAVFKFISEHDLNDLGLSFIEVNLSVDQCVRPDFPDVVERLQQKYGISPSQVNFEITESAIGSVDRVMGENLVRLFKMGYRFALDDYGVGYSNIQRIRNLPLDLVKVDKSLVDDMFTNDGDVIMRNTVSMMRGIRKKLVIEGVETREAFEVLEALSCDYIQGYHFSKPLPADEFLEFISKNRAQVEGVDASQH